MKKSRDLVAELMALSSRAQVRARLAATGDTLTLSQAQQLSTHMQTLADAPVPVRLGIVRTYTTDLLDPWLDFEAALQGLAADVYHAPYGMTVQEATPGSGLVRHEPDVTVLMLRFEDLDPESGLPLASFDAAQRQALADRVCQRIVGLAGQFRDVIPGHILVSLLPDVRRPGLGGFDTMSDSGEAAWRHAAKSRIATMLQESVPSATLLDLDESLAEIGRAQFFDRRFWYTARFPFSPLAARDIARRIVAVAAVRKLPRAKVIVLDADNTLWGGIIGEDGMQGIGLGPDYPGNCFVEFQRRLLDFQQRGFILAMCSKNNPQDALEVLRSHPHQVLRETHFAAMRINWEPKPQNLRSLAEELNLGLESFIFVDDSHHECMAVRTELPQVEVIQTPSRAVDIPACLDLVARLEILSLTAEDREKTQMYVQERKRKELATVSGDRASYLASLEMRLSVCIDDAGPLARLAQLTQKTNQFNLTTRRYDEAEVSARIASPDWIVAHFSLADIFGDSGVVGLAMIAVAGQEATLDTLLMSCRVIGREAESAFLDALLRELRTRGVDRLYAEYLPTRKNQLVENFLPEHRFVEQGDGRWLRDLGLPIDGPEVRPIVVDLRAGSQQH